MGRAGGDATNLYIAAAIATEEEQQALTAALASYPDLTLAVITSRSPRGALDLIVNNPAPALSYFDMQVELSDALGSDVCVYPLNRVIQDPAALEGLLQGQVILDTQGDWQSLQIDHQED